MSGRAERTKSRPQWIDGPVVWGGRRWAPDWLGGEKKCQRSTNDKDKDKTINWGLLYTDAVSICVYGWCCWSMFSSGRKSGTWGGTRDIWRWWKAFLRAATSPSGARDSDDSEAAQWMAGGGRWVQRWASKTATERQKAASGVPRCRGLEGFTRPQGERGSTLSGRGTSLSEIRHLMGEIEGSVKRTTTTRDMDKPYIIM